MNNRSPQAARWPVRGRRGVRPVALGGPGRPGRRVRGSPGPPWGIQARRGAAFGLSRRGPRRRRGRPRGAARRRIPGHGGGGAARRKTPAPHWRSRGKARVKPHQPGDSRRGFQPGPAAVAGRRAEVAMALSMDEQRILDEMERKLADDDPLLASRLTSFGRPGLAALMRSRRARIVLSFLALIVIAAVSLAVYALTPFRTGI